MVRVTDHEFRQSFIVSVSSAGYHAGNFARIYINDVPIYFERNESNHFRGLHICVINPLDGSIQRAEIFDTYKSSRELD